MFSHLARRLICAGSAAAFLSVPTSAQTPPKDQAKAPSVVTLNGCVVGPSGKQKAYTLADGDAGETYTLKGVDVRDLVGKRVEVSGAPASRRFVIRGGLYPNANVAAQAGDMDPTKAAMAAQAGPEANAPKPLVEFRVKSVRLVSGECPDAAR